MVTGEAVVKSTQKYLSGIPVMWLPLQSDPDQRSERLVHLPVLQGNIDVVVVASTFVYHQRRLQNAPEFSLALRLACYFSCGSRSVLLLASAIPP